MKKQYIIAFLLLVGLGVVSTMAFNIGSLGSSPTIAAPVTISGSGTENFDSAIVLPYKGSDGIFLIIGLESSTNNQTFYLQLFDGSDPIDVNSYTTEIKVGSGGSWTTSGVTWDSDYSALRIKAEDEDTAFNKVKVRLYNSGSNVFENTDQIVLIDIT